MAPAGPADEDGWRSGRGPHRRRPEDDDGHEGRHRPGRSVGRRRGSRDRRRSRTPGGADRPRRRYRSRDRGGDSIDGGASPRRRRGDEPGERPRRCDDSQSRRADGVHQRGPLPSQEASFAVSNGAEPEKPKEKPNYGNTGALAAMSNSVKRADGSSVALKYHEPSEARKPPPRDQWKLYTFKGSDLVDTVHLNLKSCWLVGRDAGVVDLLAEHPSISKQHAVVQFRYTEKTNSFGDKVGRVKPYLLDLESANGTMLNDGRIPESRYLELRDKDVVQFGDSTREYVVMLAPREE